MSEVFKATKNKRGNLNSTTEKTEVFKATKNKTISTPQLYFKNKVNAGFAQSRKGPLTMTRVQNDIKSLQKSGFDSVLQKVQHSEFVSADDIESAAKYAEEQYNEGWAALENPDQLQKRGKEIADGLRKSKVYYSLFKDEDDYKQNKENVDKRIAYSNYSTDDVKKHFEDSEGRKKSIQNEISDLNRQLKAIEEKKRVEGRAKGVGAIKKQKYEDQIREIKKQIEKKQKELNGIDVAYLNTDGSAVSWKNALYLKLSNDFKVDNEDGSTRGLTYAEAKKKLKNYSPDSEEYKFLRSYMDYVQNKEYYGSEEEIIKQIKFLEEEKEKAKDFETRIFHPSSLEEVKTQAANEYAKFLEHKDYTSAAEIEKLISDLKNKNKAFSLSDGTEVSWGDLYAEDLDEKFKGLTYNEVQEKLKQYSPDSKEYKYLKNYTGYTDSFSASIAAGDATNPEDRAFFKKKAHDLRQQEYKNELAKNEDWEKCLEIGKNAKEIPIDEDVLNRLTPTEKEIYYYMLGQDIYYYGGKGYYGSQSYIDIDLAKVLEDREEQEILDWFSKTFDENPWLEVLTGASVAANTLSAAEYVVDSAGYIFTGEMDDNISSRISGAIRNGISEKVDWEIGNWDAFDFVYQAGMSTVDSAATAAAFGKVAPAVLGLQAAASATNDALDRGMTRNRAFWTGITSGAFEAVFEKVSLGSFDKLKATASATKKQIIKNIAKEMLVNASEETLTEVANIVYDTIANGEFSEYETMIRQFMDEGMTEEEARRKAGTEFGFRIIEAAGAGAVSGGMFGAGGSAISYSRTASVGKTINKNGTINQVLDIGLTFGQDTDIYKAAQQLKSGGKISNAQLGKLAMDIMESTTETKASATRDAVYNRVKRLGADNREAGKIADFFESMVKKDGTAKKGVLNNSYAKQIISELADGKADWVNRLNTEIEDAKAKEQAIRDAITPKKTSDGKNSELQSTAEDENFVDTGSGIDGESVQSGVSSADGGALPNGTTKVPSPTSNDGNNVTRILTNKDRHRVDKREQDVISRICKALGIKAQFEHITRKKMEEITGEKYDGFLPDGYYDPNTKTVHLGYAAVNPIKFVLKHELTHFGEGTAAYKRFVAAVKRSSAFKSWIKERTAEKGTTKKLAQRYQDIISGNYSEDTNLESEMISDFVGDMLFTEDGSGLESMLSDLEVKDRNAIIQYLRDFFAYLKKKFAGDKDISFAISHLEDSFNRMISQAVQEQTQKNTAENSGGVQFSIASDSIGKYVKVDVKQDIFANKTLEEMQSIAKNIILNTFKHKVLKVGEEGKAYVNKRSAEEYTHPANRRLSEEIRESKYKVAPELDKLLEISQFVGNEPDDGSHPDATGGWDNYVTRFEVAGSMFEGNVKIKVTDRGYVFYDITQIKRITRKVGQTDDTSAAASGNPSNDSISNKNESVNNNSMQDVVENTQKVKFSFAREYDADYLELAKEPENNRAELQEMVEAAAYDAGLKYVGLHGTTSFGFTKFNRRMSDNKGAFYFTNKYRVAQTYGGTEGSTDISSKAEEINGLKRGTYKVALDIKKPLEIECDYCYWNDIPFDIGKKGSGKNGNATTRDIEMWAEKRGYDGVIFHNLIDYAVLPDDVYDTEIKNSAELRKKWASTVYAVFDTKRIKSLDPVTYDNRGNVIPLSQRFNPKKKDIRFSVPGKSVDSYTEEQYNDWESYELTSEFISKVPYSERSTFLRSLANKTNGMRQGERKNVVIITDKHIYFYEATGYMNGSIAKKSGFTKKLNAEIEKWSEYYGNIDTGTTTPYKMAEDYEGGRRRSDWDYDASQDSLTKRQNDEMVESSSDSDSIKDTWESNGDFGTDEELIPGSLIYTEHGEAYKVNEGGLIENIQFSDHHSEADSKESAFSMPDETSVMFNRLKAGEITETEYEDFMDDFWDKMITETKDRERAQRIEAERYKRQAERRLRRQKEQLQKRRSEVVREETERRQERADKQTNINVIRREIRRLDNKLRRNTDKQHIPEEMKEVTAYFVKIFVDNDTSPFKKKDIRDIRTLYSDLLGDYNIATGEGELKTEAFDFNVLADLKRLEERLSGKTLRELDLWETALIRNIVENFAHIINHANEMFVAGRSYETDQLGAQALREVKSNKAKRTNAVINGMDGVKYSNMTPIYFFDRLGSVFKRLFGDVLNGQDKCVRNWEIAKTYISQLKEKHHYSEWGNDTLKFVTEKGDKVELTVEQAMLLYATAKREYGNKWQKSEHLFKGGVVITPDVKVLNDFVKKYKASDKKGRAKIYESFTREVNSRAIRITPLDAGKVLEWLTKEQRAYADGLVEYLSNDMAALGNEVSMKLFGIRKFNENYYIPYNSAQNYLYSQPGVTSETRLKHQSFTKETVVKANNPLLLTDFSTVCADHINRMCMYNALTIPLENLNRIFNHKTFGSDTHNAEDMKAEIERTYGSGAVTYIKQFLNDVNGNLQVSTEDKFLNRWMSKFKKGAVFASASVVIQQPSAIMRAMAYIKPKYFAKTTLKLRERDYQQACKYAPVAVLKEMGRFDTGVGIATTKWLLQEKPKGFKNVLKATFDFKDSSYRDDKLSYFAAKADEITWAHIWAAVKAEIADTTELKKGTEEFFKTCGERFTEVINYTQVYDSTISRSQIMRNKNSGVQMLTSFMSEPTVSLNLLMNAVHEAKSGTKEGRKYARGAVGAFVGNVILNALLKSLVTAGRDDDEEKTYGEKYLENAWEEIVDSINPLTMIPFVKDIISIFEGYSVERADMNLFSDLAEAFNILDSEKKTPWEKVEKVSGALAAFLGLPLKNILRDCRTAYNIANDVFVTDKIDRKVNAEVDKYMDELEGNKTFESLTDEEKEKLEKDLSKKVRAAKSKSDDGDEFAELYKALRKNRSEYNKKRAEMIAEGYTADEISEGVEIARILYMKSIGIDVNEYLLYKIATNTKHADKDGSGGVSTEEKKDAVEKMDLDQKAKDYFIGDHK